MQILRTILIIIIFYYGFKFLFRVVFPLLITSWANKKMQEFQQNAQNQFKSEEQAKQFVKQHEGEVKISSHTNTDGKTTTKNNKPETDGLGDYVDYEEVK